MQFGFSDRFARFDRSISDKLADNILIIFGNGETCVINAEFEWHLETDELTKRVGDTYPVLREIEQKDAHIFEDWEYLTIQYRHVQFSVVDFKPTNDRRFRCELRQERILT